MLSVLIVPLAVFAITAGADKPAVRTDDIVAANSTFPQSQVAVRGTSLTLNGREWWPIGINAYQLGTNWSLNAGCGAQVDLDRYFAGLAPNSLTRVNIYSAFAVDKFTGRPDLSRLDAIFAAAARHNQLLIAVLAGGDGGCETGSFKQHDWYTDGWKRDHVGGLPMTYAQWLDLAVQRWGRSPALAGWTAVGEPEPSLCADEACEWQLRTCPADAARVLRAFFDQVGARIRLLDRDAVIFSGQTGGGQCGSAGDDYPMVSASPGIDVMEYHYYRSTDTLPGDSRDGLQTRIRQARELNKPLLVAEMGIEAGTCNSVDQRMADTATIVTAQRRSGTAGVLYWSYVPDPRADECTLDIGPGDPLLSMVGSAEG